MLDKQKLMEWLTELWESGVNACTVLALIESEIKSGRFDVDGGEARDA